MTMPNQNQTSWCVTLQQFEARNGQRVLIVGTYHAVALRQGIKTQNAVEDHASVRLSDGSEILLEPSWSESARREPEERSQFDNQLVEVEGVAHVQSPRPSQPIAYVIGPCLSPVMSIRLLPEENHP